MGVFETTYSSMILGIEGCWCWHFIQQEHPKRSLQLWQLCLSWNKFLQWGFAFFKISPHFLVGFSPPWIISCPNKKFFLSRSGTIKSLNRVFNFAYVIWFLEVVCLKIIIVPFFNLKTHLDTYRNFIVGIVEGCKSSVCGELIGKISLLGNLIMHMISLTIKGWAIHTLFFLSVHIWGQLQQLLALFCGYLIRRGINNSSICACPQRNSHWTINRLLLAHFHLILFVWTHLDPKCKGFSKIKAVTIWILIF